MDCHKDVTASTSDDGARPNKASLRHPETRKQPPQSASCSTQAESAPRFMDALGVVCRQNLIRPGWAPMLQLETSSSSNVPFASRAARKEKDLEPRKIVPGAPPRTAAVGCASTSAAGTTAVPVPFSHRGPTRRPRRSEWPGPVPSPRRPVGEEQKRQRAHGLCESLRGTAMPAIWLLGRRTVLFRCTPRKERLRRQFGSLLFNIRKDLRTRYQETSGSSRKSNEGSHFVHLSLWRSLPDGRHLAERQRPGDSWPEEEEGGPFRRAHVTGGWVAVPGEREAPDPEAVAKQPSRVMQRMHRRPVRPGAPHSHRCSSKARTTEEVPGEVGT